MEENTLPIWVAELRSNREYRALEYLRKEVSSSSSSVYLAFLDGLTYEAPLIHVIERYQRALQFYADTRNWTDSRESHMHEIAREALLP